LPGPERKSPRLRAYDYADGAYFVTVCTLRRACLFGAVVDDEMRLNALGSTEKTQRAEWNRVRRMIARAVRYESVSRESWDIGREWFKQDYLPVAMDTEGFAGAYLLHDDERMCTMSITLWRDEATAAASGTAVQQHLDAWEEMTGIKATVETFEVVAAEFPAGVPRA
jgi:hypothetical protein